MYIQSFFSSMYSRIFCGRLIICYALICAGFFELRGQELRIQSPKIDLLNDFYDIEFDSKNLDVYAFVDILDSLDQISDADEKIAYRNKFYQAIKQPESFYAVKFLDSILGTALPYADEANQSSQLQLYTTLGFTRLFLKEYIESVEFNNYALEIKKDHPAALLNMAKSYMRLGDIPLAIKLIHYLEEQVDLTPLQKKEVFMFHAKLISKSKPKKAIKYIQEAVHVTPFTYDFEEVRRNNLLARCYLALKDTLRSKLFLQKAIVLAEEENINRALPKALLISSDLLRYEGHLDSARVLAEQAYVIHRDSLKYGEFNSLSRLYIIYSMQNDSSALDQILDQYLYHWEKNNTDLNQVQLLSEEFATSRERLNSYFQDPNESSFDTFKLSGLIIMGLLIWLVWWKREVIVVYGQQLNFFPIIRNNDALLKGKHLSLNPETFSRENVMDTLGISINLTDWKVIEVLMAQPLLTLEEIADEVFLSKDGIKTSLRRLYKAFDITEGNAKKVRLIQRLNIVKEQIENRK